MSTNNFCPCGNLAVRFCTCQKPSKAYLCDNCLSSHVSKPGTHSLFDSKVNDLLNPDLQNARSLCTRQIVACVDQISAVIVQEMNSANAVINEMYQQHCYEVLQKYEKAARDIATVQQELLGILEKVRENAKQLEIDLKVELLPETANLAHVCWTGEYQVAAVLDLRRETAEIVGNQTGTTAAAVIASWGCQGTCGKCTSKAVELDFTLNGCKKQQLLSFNPVNFIPAEKIWICTRCNLINCQTSEECENCAFKREAIESPQLARKASDIVWTCANPACKYEYNLKKQGACIKCSTPKP